jgi:hypothetical protein
VIEWHSFFFLIKENSVSSYCLGRFKKEEEEEDKQTNIDNIQQ